MSYLWDFGDPDIPQFTEEDPGFRKFTSNGIFKVKVTVTDNEGATDSDSIIVVVSLPAAENLINRWDFEPGTITTDLQGNADLVNHGDIANETAGTEPSPPGYGSYGVVLNGTDQYFSISQWNSIEPWQQGKPAGTFAIAIKTPASFSGSNSYLLAKYSTSGQRTLALSIDPGGVPNLLLGYNNGDSAIQYNFASALLTNKRYILFFALDAQNKIYLLRAYNVDSGNWLKDALSTFTVNMNLTGNAPWTIGSRSNDDTGYFPGIIYWARIYNAYLSPAAMEEMTAFPTEIKNFAYAEKMQPVLNYPNPFSSSTTIKYSIPETTSVRIDILDIRGSIIKTLINRKMPVGEYTVVWNCDDESGKEMPGGLYFCRLKTGSFIMTNKMSLIR